MDDNSIKEKAISLLKQWLYADYRFDLEEWTKDVRDFIEDEIEDTEQK